VTSYGTGLSALDELLDLPTHESKAEHSRSGLARPCTRMGTAACRRAKGQYTDRGTTEGRGRTAHKSMSESPNEILCKSRATT
jgi:hypothetical protein